MKGFFRQNISAAPEIAYAYVKRKEDPAMLTAEENDFLTQTGPDTPMGQYFRRFWQPVALSEELPGHGDGPPKKVTVMGEELVLFATPRAGSACSTGAARIAEPISITAGTRNAACAASITVGSSTWRARASTLPTYRPACACMRKCESWPIRHRKPAK